MINTDDADQPQGVPPLLSPIWQQGEKMPEKSAAVKISVKGEKIIEYPSYFCVFLIRRYHVPSSPALVCNKVKIFRFWTKEQSARVCVGMCGATTVILGPDHISISFRMKNWVCICI